MLLVGDGGEPAHNLGIELVQAAAKESVPGAALVLGRMLLALRGHAEEGVRWLRVAANEDAWEACYWLGLAHGHGHGVDVDPAESRRLHHLAASSMGSSTHPASSSSLLLDQGVGGPRDPEGARRWELCAAEAGHPRACLNLASRLASAEPPDWAAAMEWYERAAAAGNGEAAARLCRMYLTGQGGTVDAEAAKHWFAVAVSFGHDFGDGSEPADDGRPLTPPPPPPPRSP